MLAWNDDRVKQKTSLRVLLDWLTTAGNYARWAQDRSTRDEISGEIQALRREQGIEHRSNSSIKIKIRIWILEQSVVHALAILRRQGYGNLTTLDPCAMNVKISILSSCPQFQELAPIMKAATSPRQSETKVEAVDDRSHAQAIILNSSSGMALSYPNTHSAALAKSPIEQKQEPMAEHTVVTAGNRESNPPNTTDMTKATESSMHEREETASETAAEPAKGLVSEGSAVREEPIDDLRLRKRMKWHRQTRFPVRTSTTMHRQEMMILE